jgi:hypothetical protein
MLHLDFQLALRSTEYYHHSSYHEAKDSTFMIDYII